MVDNPYKVLGLSEGASEEEIKKAYRQKAKECHPDLHPNDPHAQEKMNEVNEAYDMLTNPEKYAGRSSGYSSTGFSGSYGTSGTYNTQGQSYNQYSNYNGNNGWSSNSFSTDDLFSFFFGNMGGRSESYNTNPGQQAYNSEGNNGHPYRRRRNSLLRMIGRVIVFLLVMRFIRVIFALMMSGGMYQMMR